MVQFLASASALDSECLGTYWNTEGGVAKSGQRMKMLTYFYLVLRLRMHGTLLPHPLFSFMTY
jgi:hypothetical protein